MIKLVGQYDSPFVRRAAIALHHHGIAFERIVKSVFQDFDAVLATNPLGKVPSLVLDDGQALHDSKAIIEFLESTAPPAMRLTLAEPQAFLDMLKIEAVGIGLAEKTYERGIEFARRSPGTQDPAWIDRLERQIASALTWLEHRATDGFFVAGRLSRADLAVAAATTYLAEKQPQLYGAARFPALERHRTRCEALPAFTAAAYSEAEALATGWRPEAP